MLFRFWVFPDCTFLDISTPPDPTRHRPSRRCAGVCFHPLSNTSQIRDSVSECPAMAGIFVCFSGNSVNRSLGVPEKRQPMSPKTTRTAGGSDCLGAIKAPGLSPVFSSSAEPQNRPKSVQNPREELGSYWGPNRSTKGFAGLTGFPLLSFVLLIHFLHNISCGGFPACTMPCGGKRRQRQDVVVVVALPPTSVAAHQLVGCRLADESAIH